MRTSTSPIYIGSRISTAVGGDANCSLRVCCTTGSTKLHLIYFATKDIPKNSEIRSTPIDNVSTLDA